LTLHTDICKRVRQLAPLAVGLASKDDLVTLTFDLSICKWGHWLPVSWLPCCQFSACYTFRSRLKVRYGTDRQTEDSHQCIMPPPMGAWA